MAVSDYLPPAVEGDPDSNTEEAYNEKLRAGLIVRRDATQARIDSMVAGSAGGNPDAKDADIEHVAYLKSAYEELADINRQLVALTPPSEVVIHGIV